MPWSIRRCRSRCTVLAGRASLAARLLIDSAFGASASARMTATARATVPMASWVASAVGEWRAARATSDPEDVHGAGAVIETADAAAGHVGHADLGALDLPGAGAALQLVRDLDHLGDAGRSDRMPARDQAARH